MNEFVFDEASHKYYLDGKMMTGVTTVLGVIAKPALIQWSANMACDYIEERAMEFFNNPTKFKEVVEEARKAHAKKRDHAASLGTDVHALCETYIKRMMEEHEGMACLVDDVLPTQAQAFVTWAVDNKIKFTASEKMVYSVPHFTAGTMDFACEMDGVKYVGDIKTTSGIYGREPFAQTAAYQMMWAEREGVPPEQIAERRIIVNLKKTGTFNPEKDVYISTFYEDDIELFMAALTMYRNVGRFAPLNYLSKRKY